MNTYVHIWIRGRIPVEQSGLLSRPARDLERRDQTLRGLAAEPA